VTVADTGVAGRVVIVTGGGAGIGRGLVRHLGHAGARVVVAEWNPERLADTVDELRAEGVECLGAECDVSRRDSIQSMVAATVEHFGRVDGIVNNAMTITDFVPLAELDEAQLDVNLTSGLKGTLWAMQAVYPHMKAARWGRIVNVGSAAGIVGFKGMAGYAATKEAIRALTRTAAREWAADGIVVNLYCPVSTRHYEGTNQLLTEYKREGMAVVDALSPTGYDGDAESDVGPVVAFLLSDACRYLTGQTLMLDGGTYAFA
jgi:NAD(P)-dependent dehydrogenase (short-subunit alcohol dehydrogenase family)